MSDGQSTPALFIAIDPDVAAGVASTARDMVTDRHVVLVFAGPDGGAVVVHRSDVDATEIKQAFAEQRRTIEGARNASRAHHN